MLKEIAAWQCQKCERVYTGQKPARCVCLTEINSGNVVGVFKILSKKNGRRFNVTCLLCGLDTDVDTTNIRRQKSCGCKPRHVDILNNSEEEARYTCRKCGKTHVAELPVFNWCCEIEDES